MCMQAQFFATRHHQLHCYCSKVRKRVEYSDVSGITLQPAATMRPAIDDIIQPAAACTQDNTVVTVQFALPAC